MTRTETIATAIANSFDAKSAAAEIDRAMPEIMRSEIESGTAGGREFMSALMAGDRIRANKVASDLRAAVVAKVSLILCETVWERVNA